MKVLLIQPRPRFSIGFKKLAMVEPLGMEAVAACLPDHDVRIVDLCFHRDFESVVARFRPDACGIACSFTVEAYETIRLARILKVSPSRPFVFVGGHHASLNWGDFNNPSVDAIVVGEGEHTAQQLLDSLAGNRDLAEVPGLVLNRDGQQLFTGRQRLIRDLDSLPIPARHLTKPYRKSYYLGFERPVATIETARGCPYRCSFCSVWQFYEGKTRVRSPERVVAEVESVAENRVFFSDDNFLLNVPRAMRIASLIKERGLKKRYYMQARSDTIVEHPEVISKWAEVGLGGVFIGFEKIDEEELASVNKSNSVANNEKALSILKSHNVGVTASFIVDPNYSPKQFERLRQYVRSLRIETPSFTVLTPLPGTDLFAELKERLTTSNYELFDLFHVVLPTNLDLQEFHREFASLYGSAYQASKVSWMALSNLTQFLFTSRISASHIIRILAAWRMLKNPACYLAGYLGQPAGQTGLATDRSL